MKDIKKIPVFSIVKNIDKSNFIEILVKIHCLEQKLYFHFIT
jgi:hypothetical protein